MAWVDSGAKQIGDLSRRWDKVLHFTVLNETLAKMTLDIGYRQELPWQNHGSMMILPFHAF